MQINRLFEIVYLLLERGSVTARELAERFEISVRTVYRDIDTLSGAGIPVYATRGREGGFHLLESFSLDRSLLTVREQDEILFALQSLRATSAAECGDLLSRLSGLFHRERTDWIEVDFSDWGGDLAQKEKFPVIRAGILGRRVLKFTYYSSAGEKSERETEPLKLLFKGTWYLQAFCRAKQDFRVFRIGRMENLLLTDERFEHRDPPKEEPAAGQAPAVNLKLWFSPRAAFRIYDTFPPAQVQKKEDGSYLVSASYPEDGWVYGFLLSFGEDVRVLSPERVWRILREKAEEIVKIYPVPQNMTE